MTEILSTQRIDKISTGQRIRDVFEEWGGGLSTASFARKCIDAGVWSDDELETFTLRAAQAEVRKELKVMDSSGLPFAGQTPTRDDDGNPVWEQRAFWSPEAYVVNISDLRTRADTLAATADKLEDEGLERFGHLPFDIVDERAQA